MEPEFRKYVGESEAALREAFRTVESIGGPLVISTYSRAQAIEDGVLVDVTEWASAGFMGGFTCPVALTSALWDAVERKGDPNSTRGRAHDVLFLASLALRGALRRGTDRAAFAVLMQVGRRKKQILRAVMDGDGVTIGMRDDPGW
jgi:hypothetical protein